MKALTILALMLVAPALVLAHSAPDILLFNLPPQSPGYYPEALHARGYAFTKTTTMPDFSAALTNGTAWDLVLVDNYDAPFDDTAFASLINYIGNGGRCVLSHWDLDWGLAGIFGACMQPSGYYYRAPIPVRRWEPGNPLLTTPNAVSDLTPTEDPSPSTTDGFFLQPCCDATAVAGYTESAADYQAAIVIGNEGRTILLGLTPELFGPDMEKLLENCIEYLLAPPPLVVTLNSSSLSSGDKFAVDVDVQPLAQAFDAWGCIFGPGPVAYSFALGNPTGLLSGTVPLAANIPGLAAPYGTRLLDLTIPPGVAGEYTIVVELAPAGLDPLVPIEGYLSARTVMVQ